MKRIIILAALLPLLLRQDLSAQSIKEFENDLITLSRNLGPAVVSIKTFKKVTRVSFPSKEKEDRLVPISELSGTILSKEGYVVTVGDSLRGVDAFEVTLQEGATVKASLVGIDSGTNIGVLWIPAPSLPDVPLGDSDKLEVGSFVISVGNPYGFSHSLSTGIVSGLNRIPEGTKETEGGMIQITAVVNPGDAGGLVANSSGEIIGMISSTYRRAFSSEFTSRMASPLEHYRKVFELHPLSSAGRSPEKVVEKYISEAYKLYSKQKPMSLSGSDLAAQGINFVVPVNRVKKVASEIIEKGTYTSPGKVLKNNLGILGQWPLSAPLAAQLKLAEEEGVLVSKVFAGGVAQKGGIAQFDIIISLNGKPVNSLEGFKKQILACRPGEETSLTVVRNTQKVVLTVVF